MLGFTDCEVYPGVDVWKGPAEAMEPIAWDVVLASKEHKIIPLTY